MSLPALIRHFHEAEKANVPSVFCGGAGTPLRECLHLDDLGEACVFSLERRQPGAEGPPFLNVGTGVNITICELAKAVAVATGFRGEIFWDTSKPDPTPRKQLNVSRLAPLGWHVRIPIAQGLTSTVSESPELFSQQLTRL